MRDLIILGGGPAGLTAAMYAIRKRLDVLLVSPDLGGKTRGHMYLPDNLDRFQVINGEDVVSRFRRQVEYLEFARKIELAAKVEATEGGYAVTTEAGNRYEARAVLVATGAGAAKLNVPGEVKYRLHGLAYSAASYAPLFIDRTAAVVGAGELGVRSALELAQNARQVYFVVPDRSILESPKGHKLRESANVTLLDGYRVKEIKGDGTYAHTLVVTRDGRDEELPVDVTFVELDLLPHSECVAGLVDLNEKRQIVVNCSNHTSRPGIFAAGDVTDTYGEQVLICIGEGAKAALSAYEYLLGL
jgi:alkyl hydroperoxide reductase subunit F